MAEGISFGLTLLRSGFDRSQIRNIETWIETITNKRKRTIFLSVSTTKTSKIIQKAIQENTNSKELETVMQLRTMYRKETDFLVEVKTDFLTFIRRGNEKCKSLAVLIEKEIFKIVF